MAVQACDSLEAADGVPEVEPGAYDKPVVAVVPVCDSQEVVDGVPEVAEAVVPVCGSQEAAVVVHDAYDDDHHDREFHLLVLSKSCNEQHSGLLGTNYRKQKFLQLLPLVKKGCSGYKTKQALPVLQSFSYRSLLSRIYYTSLTLQ